MGFEKNTAKKNFQRCHEICEKQKKIKTKRRHMGILPSVEAQKKNKTKRRHMGILPSVEAQKPTELNKASRSARALKKQTHFPKPIT